MFTEVLKARDWLKKVKAVVFDFDGTLAVLNIDFKAMRDGVFELMQRFDVKEEWIRERYLLEVIDEVCTLLERKSPSLAIEFYQEAHEILHGVEMKAAEEGRLFPEAEETLTCLRASGLKVGIVTRNCEDAVRKVFPRIDDFCDVFISRDSVKKVKPHPDHLSAVMKALEVSGEEAMIIGDHTIDIQAGKKIGMKTVGVLTGRITREEFENAGADCVLEDVREVRGLFPATNIPCHFPRVIFLRRLKKIVNQMT